MRLTRGQSVKAALALLLTLWVEVAAGQGWLGQGRVSRPDSTLMNIQPCIVADDVDFHWAVWCNREHDNSLVYARWLGDRWDEERIAVPHPSGVLDQLRPSICLDDERRPWLVWNDAYRNNRNDIGSSRWNDTGWAPEVQVNLPDSTELDFAPEVASGGNQVWCTWYGGPTDTSPYMVYANRWNPDSGCWEPEMRVNPRRPEQWQWWCDVAVDGEGTPHVVWVAVPACTVYCSYYEAGQWQGPFPVNDSMVRAASWADPHIVIDHTGVMHVSYTGAARGATGRDIFYSRNDGTGWTPSVRVTQDTLYNCDEWYSDIAADRPDNIWVVWDRQGEGPDDFRVYASHYDGVGWSPEVRLDNDSAYGDRAINVCLDGQGNPWVVWSGNCSGRDYHVFYNRYANAGFGDTVLLPLDVRFSTEAALISSAGGFVMTYTVSATARIRLEVYDGSGRRIRTIDNKTRPAGRYTARWDGCREGGKQAPSGAYFCRLKADDKDETTCKLILLAR